jgi:hypothetical protein
MRWQVVAAVLGSAALTVAACGSESASTFTDGSDAGGGTSSGGSSSSSGSFVPTGDSGPPPADCQPKTCADKKATCGPIGDDCGGIVQCGNTCPDGETCGGGGIASQCGKPACTPKTCLDLNADCGQQGDGCGGTISCGTCEAGICGGGGPSKCGTTGGNVDGGVCVPTKSACAPGDCGPIGDGCGNLLQCGLACPQGETCGGGPTPSICGAPPCVKDTCGTSLCGFKADGCGGLLNCWPQGTSVCPPGQSCGGGPTPNECGTPPGCTGLCLQQQQCPGGGTTSIEGYVTSPNGVLPIPNAVVYVPNGAVAAFPTTGVTCESCATASGSPLITTTTDANGHFLLPNMPVSTPGKVVDIPVVVQLGRWRKQLTIQTTACTNNLVPAFGTAGVPASRTAALPRTKAEGDIPLTAISTGNVDGLECVFRKIGVADSEFTSSLGTGRIRLYQENGLGSGEGGACAPGCGTNCADSGNNTICPKSSKLTGGFVYSLDIERVRRVNGQPIQVRTNNNHGLQTGAQVVISNVNNASGANGTFTITRVDDDDFTLNGTTANNGATYENDDNDRVDVCDGVCATADIEKYDAVVFGCVGGQANKPAFARNNVINYANKGGRVFATHFSYVWLYTADGFTSPWAATANTFNPGRAGWDSATAPGSISAYLDTSFPKGVLFSNWLQAPVGTPPPSYPPPYAAVNGLWSTNPPQLALTEPRADIEPAAANLATSGIIGPAQRWIYTDTTSTVFNPASDTDPARNAPMHYTFNTPWGAQPANQCGRVLFSDFHVSTGSNTGNKVFPAECNANALTAQEKVLAYMLFDLASCVSTSGPPACVPKDCNAQGIACGPAGDGCGNQIACGDCPNGQTCGGGGIPNQCGAPACTPKTCAANQCGLMGNGCGGQLDCGNCTNNQVCGAGGPNQCGVGACVPGVCPAPAPGSTCGPVANGCGGLNNCPCPANTPCVNGTCGTPPCTPRTCQQAGANCGQVADGCGGIQNCGTCVAPQTCGGGGTANICGGGVN